MGKFKNIALTAKVYSNTLASNLKTVNRRTAQMNRLRTVARCEERAAEKEYLALGRYYYNALRNKDDAIAEAHCARIDEIQARRDAALETLEGLAKEAEAGHNMASSVAVISGADGPTAVFATKKPKAGTLFHFDKGPIEITVSRDPAPDADSEEIDLSDVESFDHDPMPESSAPEPASAPLAAAEFEVCPAAEQVVSPGTESDENVDLPFEG